MNLTINSVAGIDGKLRTPSDKSLTHRAYMLGAVANGRSVIRQPLRGEDCEATRHGLEQMGLVATETPDGAWLLDPAAEWVSPTGPIDCGNSGTTMRLLSGLIASRPLEAVLIGDASLSKRPMGRIADPLRLMGAVFDPVLPNEIIRPPIRIRGSANLTAIDYKTPVASAQIKSCILLAGLRAQGTTRVKEPSPSRDHTERMLRAAGVAVTKGEWISLKGGSEVQPFEFTVPADISSAAFFMVAAAIAPRGRIVLEDVGVNPTRTGILDVFDQCGIPYSLFDVREELGEPTASIEVRSGVTYKSFEISGDLVPRLIDEIPVLAVLATQCQGTSVIRDAKELRVKESDRIETVATALRQMGATVETFDDGMAIRGPVRLKGATIATHGDHRIAMAFAVAGLIAEGTTTIAGAESIATSFPDFEGCLMKVSVL